MGREEGSGWGTHVYMWLIHFDIWQNQYNIVKLKNKNKLKKKKKLNRQAKARVQNHKTSFKNKVKGNPLGEKRKAQNKK